jgi:hypothetical protein
MVEECSPSVEKYKHMKELADQYLQQDRSDIKLGFVAATTGDMRRHNHPTKEEVAAVFVAEDGAPPGYRDMVLYVMRTRTTHQHLRGRVSKKLSNKRIRARARWDPRIYLGIVVLFVSLKLYELVSKT